MVKRVIKDERTLKSDKINLKNLEILFMSLVTIIKHLKLSLANVDEVYLLKN